MAETDKVKIVTKITSFDDVQKSLQEVENKLNILIKSVNDVSEKETSETEGKSGDINITRNADGTYGLETCTNEGWKKMYVSNKTTAEGTSEVYLGDKPKIVTKLSTTESFTSSVDSRYLPSTPDYDSGWIRYIWTDNNIDVDPALSVPHTLGVLPTMIIAYIAPDQGSGSNGDAVASSEITYFTQMSGHHMGSSSAGQARYGMVFKVTSSAVLFTSGDASAGYWSNFNTGSAASAKENNGSHSIRYLLWK